MRNQNTLAVTLFLLGVGVNFLIPALTARRGVNSVFGFFAVLFFIAGIAWYVVDSHPSSGFGMQFVGMATSPWAWFELVVLGLVTSSIVVAAQEAAVQYGAPNPSFRPRIVREITREQRRKIAEALKRQAYYQAGQKQVKFVAETRNQEFAQDLAELVRIAAGGWAVVVSEHGTDVHLPPPGLSISQGITLRRTVTNRSANDFSICLLQGSIFTKDAFFPEEDTRDYFQVEVGDEQSK